jgi:hypothetical protein
MTWRKAITRLSAVNAVILLPLWLLLLCTAWRFRRQAKRSWRDLMMSSFPLITAFLFIAILRGYFAHHPWMAGPVILFAIVFTLKLLLDPMGPADGEEASRPLSAIRVGLPAIAGCIYSFVVLLILNQNVAGGNALQRLALDHTARHDVIVFSSKEDPWIAENYTRLGELMDRALVPLPDSEAGMGTAAHPGAKFRLTASVPAGDRSWLAQSKPETLPGQRSVGAVLQWYRTQISRRARTDRLELDRDFYLYKMP